MGLYDTSTIQWVILWCQLIRHFFFVEDIPLCLKYNIKMKSNIYSVWHNYLFILLFQMLATSFGLNRPSSDQYLQNLKMLVHIT